MPQVTLNVELRDKTGHRTGRFLRRNGRVPGVFYAHGEDAVTISMDTIELNRILNTEVNIIDVTFPGNSIKKSVLKEVQVDPVTEEPVHVDIMGINIKEKIRLKIPVLLKGTPTGVKDQGGILVHPIREVEIEGLPLELPEHITVEISELAIGDSVTIGHLESGKFVFVDDEHEVVANVVHPRVVEAEEEAEEELLEGEEAGEEAEEQSEESNE